MKIVLIHGIFSTGHLMFWIKRKLEKCGFECFSPTLWPFDGRKGIEYASANLKKQIDERFGKTEKISLIGFSMGGIVARYYLQEMDGASRVNKFFSIASPHKGSYWAYFPYPTKGVKQLRPNSQFLKQLEASENSLKNVKLFSYWTPLDLSIIPSSNSYWKVAENKKFFSLSHISIIFNRKVISEIILRLKETCKITKGTEPNE